MSRWELFGRITAVLLLWAVSVVAFAALRLAIGDDWMLWVYRSVAGSAIGGSLMYVLVVKPGRI